MSAPRCPVVDFHAHVVEPSVYEKTINHNVITGYGARPLSGRPERDSPRWKVYSRMTDPAVHIADMDRWGIGVNLISTSTISQSTWWAGPAEAAALERQGNEQVADWVRRHPDRFVGAFTMPMQDLRLALAELDYAVNTLKLRVANVSSNVGGTYLGDPRFRPFWQAVTELGVPVLIHPHGATGDFYQKYALWNSVGQPVEESLVMASIIYEGILETFPEVTIVIVHGGGYLPHYPGRLDRAATYHPISAQNLKKMPSEYLKAFYYDSCVYDPTVLDALIERVGADRIVLGSDYPFGEDDPVGVLRRSSRVSDDVLDLMVRRTPARILGLSVADTR